MTITTKAGSDVEKNKTLIKKMLQCLSAGDINGFVDELAPNFVRHNQAMPPELQEIRGKEVMRQWLEANRSAFPDYRENIDVILGEGEFVAYLSLGTGTQAGPMGPFPATGKVMNLAIFAICRFENGKVAEIWSGWDNVAAMAQLGHLPPPPAR